MLPLVALVGRPNVGKSTLFNRIVGRRLAIVEDTPGVTRDRQYAEAQQGARKFRVVDTGGFTIKTDELLIKAVREQAEHAIRDADVIVLVIDALEGLAGADQELAQILRRGGKPVLLAANKVDSNKRNDALELGELYATGFDVFPLSAEHGRGVDELMDAIVDRLPEAGDETEPEDQPIHLALLGRPNVGKSTLLNRLLGEERFVASALPGTTRNAVDEELTWKGRRYVLTDTAGLRKKRQVIDKVEVFSAQRALRAVERADVVVVLTDATELGVDQDARIAAQAEERGRAVILVVNKWDLVKDKEGEAKRLREEAARHLQHVGFAPLLFAELRDEASTRIATPVLNEWVQQMQDEHPAPLYRGFPVRFSYAYQVAVQPVTVAIQCNRPAAVDDSYRRFLVNRFRERFKLQVPVRLVFRQKSARTPRGSRPS
ncbi:MAG: ribosome biogenesis GTPase Der [Deltaproteobacteria bacterium]|nr:MAG: ribosome biogenesis GTPase Der [Deltaproteobacteria bacterium]